MLDAGGNRDRLIMVAASITTNPPTISMVSKNGPSLTTGWPSRTATVRAVAGRMRGYVATSLPLAARAAVCGPVSAKLHGPLVSECCQLIVQRDGNSTQGIRKYRRSGRTAGPSIKLEAN